MERQYFAVCRPREVLRHDWPHGLSEYVRIRYGVVIEKSGFFSMAPPQTLRHPTPAEDTGQAVP